MSLVIESAGRLDSPPALPLELDSTLPYIGRYFAFCVASIESSFFTSNTFGTLEAAMYANCESIAELTTPFNVTWPFCTMT